MDGYGSASAVAPETAMPDFPTSKDDETDGLGLRMGADDYVKTVLPAPVGRAYPRIASRQDAVATDEVGDTEETKVMERGDLRMDPLRHAVSWKATRLL
jgi:two-component system response regulator ChvI